VPLLDKFLFIGFGSLSLLSLGWSAICIYRALKAASRCDDGIRMFLWGVGALAGFALAGASIIFFLLPIWFANS